MTAATIASTVQAVRQAGKAPIVLVEGSTDSILYRRFLAHESTYSLISCVGKANLLAAMRLIEVRRVEGVVAICDADYDSILGGAAPPPVYATDVHDSEVMCWMADVALDCVRELILIAGQTGQFTPEDVVDQASSIASRIGMTRLRNLENGWGIAFKTVDVGGFIDSAMNFDAEAYLSALLDASIGASATRRDLESVFKSAIVYPIADLVNGHDLASLLDAICFASSNQPRLGGRAVEAMFRLGLHPDRFAKTALAAGIRKWESETGFEILSDEVAA